MRHQATIARFALVPFVVMCLPEVVRVSQGQQIGGKTAPSLSGTGVRVRNQDPASPQNSSLEIEQCTIRLLDEVILAFDRPGIVAFVGVREGDGVRAGQLVAGLQDDLAQAGLAIAEKDAENDFDIRYAEQAAEVAEVEHQAASEINRRSAPLKGLSEIEARRIQLAAKKAQTELEAALHRRAVNQLKRVEAQAQLDR